MPIEWNEQYAVGDARTDSQHRNLFTYVNRLEQLIEEGRKRGLDRQAVENLFIFLDAYVNTHFAYEELCMTLRACPAARKNKEAHDKFLAFWNEFNRQHNPNSVGLVALEELHAALAGWLTQHICRIDVALRKN
ncbi:hemerythrin [Meiothermus sp. QL-1]|uniref:bacteriohemerythrin n=1 Tax=Meiothermus sp. QL-1 TaxID=2058095 RepID=UPI000E0C4816|nr:hemerythrin family protein [Meiothermus sp. QL-1]RDI96399.1 hemerythrin [Meiothermus sp. QL-1]